MMKHYSEVELLELYYVPGAATQAYLHVAGCDGCRTTYERLQGKLRTAASSCDRVDEKPETFWTRQRLAILRDVARATPARSVHSRYFAAAAAAILITISGMTWNANMKNSGGDLSRIESRSTQLASVTTDSEADISAAAANPWDSEQLNEYGSVIEWESWDTPAAPAGGQS